MLQAKFVRPANNLVESRYINTLRTLLHAEETHAPTEIISGRGGVLATVSAACH